MILVAIAHAGPMVEVPAGTYEPLYPPSEDEAQIEVPAFRMDVYPVTNAEFRVFVDAHPEWAPGAVPPLYADDAYLAHWRGEADPRQPVTNVSWWAARAYCEAQGRRLPTEAEWERAAAEADTAKLLAWYSKPGSAELPRVGQGEPNALGLHDLHGVVWEWVEDFNSALISFDNRQDGGTDELQFCGSAAYGAADKEDYAAFMRVGFRAALQGAYTTRNLGFRCASGGG